MLRFLDDGFSGGAAFKSDTGEWAGGGVGGTCELSDRDWPMHFLL